MRKFYSAIMALSVLLFASCDKDNIGNNNVEGTEAKVGLTLSFPTTMTKAANDHDENATESEASVSSITVFIFESDGSHADGSPANYDGDLSSSFTIEFSSTINKYTLKEPIETSEGTKNIYAAVNLPSDLRTMNEVQLKAAQTTTGLVTSVTVTPTTSSQVSMISTVSTKNLKAYEGNDVTDINEVQLTVERMMSKIAVTENGSSTTHQNTKEGGKFYITPDAFTVGNIPTKIFPIQKIVSSKLVTPGLEIDGNGNPIPTAPILPGSGVLEDNINPKKSATTAKHAFYVPEHSPSNSRYDATYAVVRAEFTFEQLVDDVESDGTIKLKTAFTDFATQFTDNFVYAVQNSLYTYFCEDVTMANKVNAALTDAKVFKFHRDIAAASNTGKFYAFYYVFINNDKYDDGSGSGSGYHKNERLALYRNLYYNILVNGVDGIGVPGNNGDDPGDGDDEPYNPPTEPPVVDPTDPDPVYGELAKLLVEIDVEPWVYRAPEVILEPLK